MHPFASHTSSTSFPNIVSRSPYIIPNTALNRAYASTYQGDYLNCEKVILRPNGASYSLFVLANPPQAIEPFPVYFRIRPECPPRCQYNSMWSGLLPEGVLSDETLLSRQEISRIPSPMNVTAIAVHCSQVLLVALIDQHGSPGCDAAYQRIADKLDNVQN